MHQFVVIMRQQLELCMELARVVPACTATRLDSRLALHACCSTVTARPHYGGLCAWHPTSSNCSHSRQVGPGGESPSTSGGRKLAR